MDLQNTNQNADQIATPADQTGDRRLLIRIR